jgi:hypothetical protein
VVLEDRLGTEDDGVVDEELNVEVDDVGEGDEDTGLDDGVVDDVDGDAEVD